MILTPSQWTQQPPPGTPINRGSALAVGLKHALNFNAVAPFDAVSGAQFTTSGSPTLTANRNGLALKTVAASSQYGFIPTSLTAGPLTLLWIGRIAAIPGATQAVVSLGTAAGTERGVLFINATSTFSGSVIPNSGTADASVSTAAGLHQAALIVTPAGQEGLAVDGAVSVPGTMQWSPTGAITRLYVGVRVNTTPGVFLDAETNAVFAWSRQLSDAEFRSLYINPWQIFAPLPRRLFAPPAVAGGTTFTATLTASSAASAVIAKAIASSKVVTSNTTPTVAKAVSSTKTATSTASVTVSRAAQLVKAVSSTASALIAKAVSSTKTASSSASAAIVISRAFLKTLTATSTLTATVASVVIPAGTLVFNWVVHILRRGRRQR